MYYKKLIEHHQKLLNEAKDEAAFFDNFIQPFECAISAHRTGNQFFAPMNYPYRFV